MTLPSSTAALIMSSQVKSGESGSTPAALAAALRYHSSWVLAQNGAATSLSSQYTVFSGAVEDPLGQLVRVGLVEDAQEAGVGELGHERRVQAHQVDRAVLGGEAADELLALLRGVVGQGLDVDLVRRRPRARTSPPDAPGRRCPG